MGLPILTSISNPLPPGYKDYNDQTIRIEDCYYKCTDLIRAMAVFHKTRVNIDSLPRFMECFQEI